MANASNHEIIYSPLVNHSYFSADYELSFRPTESDLSFIQHIVQAPNFGIKQILEVGCGSARQTLPLLDCGVNVTGIDLSSPSIESAKNHENTGLSFYTHDIRDLFRIRYFNYIWKV